MNFHKKITSLHLDVLKEIGNIGAAHAATALSDLLNKKIDMRVPKVEMVSFNDMMELVGGSENVVVGIFLRIAGDAEGSMFFVVPIEQANQFIRGLIRDDTFDFKNPPTKSVDGKQVEYFKNSKNIRYEKLPDGTEIYYKLVADKSRKSYEKLANGTEIWYFQDGKKDKKYKEKTPDGKIIEYMPDGSIIE